MINKMGSKVHPLSLNRPSEIPAVLMVLRVYVDLHARIQTYLTNILQCISFRARLLRCDCERFLVSTPPLNLKSFSGEFLHRSVYNVNTEGEAGIASFIRP